MNMHCFVTVNVICSRMGCNTLSLPLFVEFELNFLSNKSNTTASKDFSLRHSAVPKCRTAYLAVFILGPLK